MPIPPHARTSLLTQLPRGGEMGRGKLDPNVKDNSHLEISQKQNWSK
jgi:hypothetical protein